MAKLVRSEGYITRFLEGKRGQPAGSDLQHLRNKELDPKLAAMLFPFINAYRKEGHRKEDIPKPESLREAGYELIRRDSFTDEVNEVYWELRGYYPDENPELLELQEVDG
jgi:hypothetical protein